MQSSFQREDGNPNVWKGVVAGMAGGLLASWTMNQFQTAWFHFAKKFEESQDGKARARQAAQSLQTTDVNNSLGPADNKEEQDNATVKAARVVSERIFGHQLQESEKEAAGSAVHYAFGTSTGGLYGAIAELAPKVTVAGGLPFGAAFWAVADETAVPLLGLSKAPTEYPVSTHAYALASHLVYGFTTEITRRTLRKIL